MRPIKNKTRPPSGAQILNKLYLNLFSRQVEQERSVDIGDIFPGIIIIDLEKRLVFIRFGIEWYRPFPTDRNNNQSLHSQVTLQGCNVFSALIKKVLLCNIAVT